MSKEADIQRLHRIIAQNEASLNNLKRVIQPKGRVRKTYINARNETNNNLTPLMRAILKRKPSFVEYFIKHGANVNARNYWDWTPLMMACQIDSKGEANPKDDVEMVRMLLKAGAQVNAKNDEGRNVILVCVRETKPYEKKYHETEYHAVLKMLLDAGANPNEKDSNGKSAVDHAIYQKDEAVLRMFGANAGPSTRRTATPPRAPPNAGPSTRRTATPPRTPPKAGFTKMPYTNVMTGLSVYKKNATGRYYVRLRVPESGRRNGTITLAHKVRNASGTIKTLREWLKETTNTRSGAGDAGPSSANASTSNGYTRTQYKTATGNPIFKKGRFHYYQTSEGTYIRFAQDRNAVNSAGRKQSLKDHLKGKKPKTPPRRASPSPPPRRAPPTHEKWTRMGYKKSVYEMEANGQRIYRKGDKYWYGAANGSFAQVMSSTRVKDTRTGRTATFSVIKTESNARKAAAGPAPAAARSVVNYDAMYKRNLTRSDLAKIRRYAKNWLGKNIPANASYKRIALVIHPDKGNRTNAVNQAKRTTLFKYLSQIK